VNTGYSVFKSGEENLFPAYPSENHIDEIPQLLTFGNITPSTNLNEQAKLETIHNLVEQLIIEHDIDTVAIEDTYYSKNAKTFKTLVRISGVVILAAQKHDCAIFLYPPSTVKKEFTGNGKAKKDEMMGQVMALFGIDEIDDNASDAIAVGCTYIQNELLKEAKEEETKATKKKKTKTKAKS
jgi:crossover junction endodeoxyribonuclease RuvC